MAVTTPDAVPGEIIEAAWGDAVRADLTAHDNLLNRLTADTGWTAVTPTGNWSGTVHYRRIGAMVVVNFSVSKVGANFGPGTLNLCTMPVQARPSVTIYGAGYVTVPVGPARAVLGTDGTLDLTLTITGGGPVVSGHLAFLQQLP